MPSSLNFMSGTPLPQGSASSTTAVAPAPAQKPAPGPAMGVGKPFASQTPNPLGSMASSPTLKPTAGVPKPMIVSTAKPAITAVNNAKTGIANVQNAVTAKQTAQAASPTTPKIGETPAQTKLRIERQNIAQTGEVTPTPVTGQVNANQNLPAGFGSDLTGKIFKLPPGQTAPTTPAPTVGAATGTTTTTGTTGATTDQTGAATAPAAPTDPVQQQLDKSQTDTKAEYDKYQQKLTDIANGSVPLTDSQQGTLNSIMSSFQNLMGKQMIGNENYANAVRELGYTTGVARYSPGMQASNIASAIDAGLSKIGELNSQMQDKLTAARTALTDGNLKTATAAYDAFTKYQDQLTVHLDKVQANTTALAKNQQDFQDKQDTLKQTAIRDRNTDAHNQAMEDIARGNMTSTAIRDQATADYQKGMLTEAQFKDRMTAADNAFKNNLEQDKANITAATNGLTKNADGTYSLDMGTAINPSGAMSPKDMANLVGVHSVMGGGMYFDRSELPKGKEGDAMAQKLSTLGIPQVPDATTRQALEKLGTATQNIDSLKAAFLDVAPEGVLGRMGEAVKNPVSELLQTERGQKLDFYNSLKTSMTSLITGVEGVGRINPTEMAQMNNSIPSPNDTREDGLKKLEGLNKLITSARNSNLGGKVIYTNLNDYTRENAVPQKTQDTMTQMHKDGVPDDTILQWAQSGTKGGGFKQESQTSSNGNLSSSFESGGNPGAIGYDSTGGTSYGTFQLAHNNAQKFVDQSPYADQFKGIAFNSPEFQQKWKEVAKQDPQGFAQAQSDFIDQTHVQPQIQKLSDAGLNVGDYSPALKQVIQSTAVQHGPGTNVIVDAYKALPKPPNEQDLIKEIYKQRWGGGSQFASSTPAVRKSVYNRFFGPNGEMNKALEMSKTYA